MSKNLCISHGMQPCKNVLLCTCHLRKLKNGYSLRSENLSSLLQREH